MKNAVVVSGILFGTLLVSKGLGEAALAIAAIACAVGIAVILISKDLTDE